MVNSKQPKNLTRFITPEGRYAFLSCLIAGFLAHIFAFTNIIPNADGLSRVFDTQQMTVSGRWFLHYISAITGYTQMPSSIGLVSLIFLGVSAALAVDLLGIKSRISAALAGVLLAIFPCIGYTFLYMFTAGAYCAAIFLAVLSVWLTRRYKLGWIFGAVALAFSMGIYQVFVTVAISLSLLLILRQTLDRTATLGEALRLGIKSVAQLIIGVGLYYAVLLVFLKVKNLTLLSYLGMDDVTSGYPIKSLPGLIRAAYGQVSDFFFSPGAADGFATTPFAAINWILLASGLALLVLALRKKGIFRDAWRIVLAAVALLLLPLGANFGQIISPYSVPTPMMKYAFVSLYLAVVVSAESARGSIPAIRLRRVGTAVLSFCFAALLVFFLNTNNLLYTASAQAHRAAESYLTRLYARVESCEGYAPGMEVVIIGAIPEGQLSAQIESYDRVGHYSVPISSVAPLNKHIYYYLKDWLNIPVNEPDEATMISVAASAEFSAMPLYPQAGSVAVIDGRVVVKLREKYTPKSDFELAYENRR
ncbi:MAG: glucosyltransferase domain-containing protein [Oscillospiraceae bacterium]|jgi:hypothetical protein|nr:glucosyltransferase domain-containing protein [Oscillospiraceae bacterium]